MVREISAGGVVLRKRAEAWLTVVIELPYKSEASTAPSGKVKIAKPVLALPKGLVDPGEMPLETAVREVFEETGVNAEVITKLGDIKYIYTRTWGDGGRVFKIVSFYLMRYRSGRIDEITAEMRIEVARARWVRLEEATSLLAYKGEKQMARRALDYVIAHADL
jgi:8-oxo-dGTP pyrophosphatase MutT (NUDIX family)